MDLAQSNFFATSIVAGDWSGDGNPDLALAGFRRIDGDVESGNIVLMHGLGDGSFAVTLGPQRAMMRLTIGDIDEDGDLDLLGATEFGDTIMVFFNQRN
jgi:hypothetical protein